MGITMYSLLCIKRENMKIFYRIVSISMCFILVSCQSLLPLFTSIEDIADDTAIRCEVSKEAIADKKDIDVTINVKNIK